VAKLLSHKKLKVFKHTIDVVELIITADKINPIVFRNKVKENMRFK
jgi:hypothetical protein